MDPPKRVKIKLSKSDIKRDMWHALAFMSKLRRDSLIDGEYTSEQQEAYLQHVYNLSSQIDILMDNPMFDKLQPLADRLGSRSVYSSYDPIQTYWKWKVPTFISELRDAALNVFREGFYETEQAYHLLQAVKYLGTKDISAEGRGAFHSTILPFQNPLPREFCYGDKSSLKENKNFSLEGNGSDLLTLKVNVNPRCNKRSLPFNLVGEAKERGYIKIRMAITGNHWVESKEEFIMRGFRPVSIDASPARTPIPMYLTVEAEINREKLPVKKVLNPLDYLESAAKLSISDITQPEHYPELTERKKDIVNRIGNPPEGVAIATHVDYPNSCLRITHSLVVEGFNKQQDLYWTNNGRYLVCVISSLPSPLTLVKPPAPMPLHECFSLPLGPAQIAPTFKIYSPHRISKLDPLDEVMISDKTSKEKLLQICEEPNVKYVHLRRFMEGVTVEDFEGFN